MKLNFANALIPLACLALVGCDFGDKAKTAKAPTGQVVATVDGDEITVRELRAELAGMTFPDAASRKQAEQGALQNIIARKLMAKAAIKAELDKTPDYAVEKQRANDILLAQAMQKKVIDGLPPPTVEEAASFVALHPDIYADRKILLVDQIRMAPMSDPAKLKALEPMKTLEEIEAYLTAQKIPYQRGAARIDVMTLNPQVTEQILKLPPGEVFVVPTPQMVFINKIRDVQVVPVTGEAATKHAQELLKRQRTEEALQRQLAEVTRAAAGKVQFAKEYEPPKPAPAPKAPAPAPAAPAAADPAAKAT